jgi:hypothetical protein
MVLSVVTFAYPLKNHKPISNLCHSHFKLLTLSLFQTVEVTQCSELKLSPHIIWHCQSSLAVRRSLTDPLYVIYVQQTYNKSLL